MGDLGGVVEEEGITIPEYNGIDSNQCRHFNVRRAVTGVKDIEPTAGKHNRG
jgi:hypothetical protein